MTLLNVTQKIQISIDGKKTAHILLEKYGKTILEIDQIDSLEIGRDIVSTNIENAVLKISNLLNEEGGSICLD